MTVDRTNMRADRTQITAIMSKSYARPVTDGRDQPWTAITPSVADRMGKTAAILQEIQWEFYDGTYGPQTLLKRVDHDTSTCPECGTIGRNDENGDVVCDDDACAVMISGENEKIAYSENFLGSKTADGATTAHESGDPHFRPPAMNPPGPSGDSDF